eukprot:gnl/MRDRNA2_/MRDRNA2_24504_c0_seq1.p1 gnl/MRDRNA2_/MRDRNA2_24504_c0~~gnl/MRDRNA2_/MRDRNA2_24504_c0_seq1.p1  ORF type:complete len:792 (-),score=148.12 gnl/MRDRNA2_/MRDRNA2_24504_c0_seq1:119-2494(-)
MPMPRTRDQEAARARLQGAVKELKRSDATILSHLTHEDAAGGQEELAIRIHSLLLPQCRSMKDLKCKLYFGEFRAPPLKADLVVDAKELDPAASFRSVHVTVPPGGRRWFCRVKLYRKGPSSFYKEAVVAEAQVPIPRSLDVIELKPSGLVSLEVVRVVPVGCLKTPWTTSSIAKRIREGVEQLPADDLAKLFRDVVAIGKAGDPLAIAVGWGRRDAAEILLSEGASVSPATLKREVDPKFAMKLLQRFMETNNACSHLLQSNPSPEEIDLCKLRLCLEMRMPATASWLLENGSAAEELKQVVAEAANWAEWMQMARLARCWLVASWLLDHRCQATHCLPEHCMEALEDGYPDIARKFLEAMPPGPDNSPVDYSSELVRACLQIGRHDMIRGSLEAQWWQKQHRATRSVTGMTLLPPSSQKEDDCESPECGVCLEPLYSVGAAKLINNEGEYVCNHLFCLKCAEDFKGSQDVRSTEHCPFCRKSFSTWAPLPDPTVDPRGFFHAIDSAATGCLSRESVLTSFAVLLPFEMEELQARISDETWALWCRGSAECACNEANEDLEPTLTEDAFVTAGGALEWLSMQLLSRKIEAHRGPPPDLALDATAWFLYFDHESKGHLSKQAILRGIARTCNLQKLSTLAPPPASGSFFEMQRCALRVVRELLWRLWDDSSWPDGISLADFAASDTGLAAQILAGLHVDTSSSQAPDLQAAEVQSQVSFSEAVAAARANDLAAHRIPQPSSARISLTGGRVAAAEYLRLCQRPCWYPAERGFSVSIFPISTVQSSSCRPVF